MNYEKLKTKLEEEKIVNFKLYSLDYTIEKKGNLFVIYVDNYKNNKKKYNTLEELFNSYNVYNESLSELLNIIYLKDEKH